MVLRLAALNVSCDKLMLRSSALFCFVLFCRCSVFVPYVVMFIQLKLSIVAYNSLTHNLQTHKYLRVVKTIYKTIVTVKM